MIERGPPITMPCRTHTPGPPLSEFVDLFWSCPGAAPSHARERLLPTGTMQVIVNLGDDELRLYDQQDRRQYRSFGRAMISGARSTFAVVDQASQASTVGVHFKPGGARPCLGVPVAALGNGDAPLQALWGARAGELRDRLLGAATPEERFAVLEHSLVQALVAKGGGSAGRHPAVAVALAEFGRLPHPAVKAVSDRTGLSQRRFIELFREEVGLTPKLFCRVRRFQAVVRLVRGEHPVGWADVALRCGYFDQAHLIRDFRAFAGVSPTSYLAHRVEQPNHVPLGD